MKWQAIANVTNQVNEEAKHYLALKLEKDAASEVPHLWSEFITGSNRDVQHGRTHLDIVTDVKTGGLAASVEFDELDADYASNGKSLLDYTMSKYDLQAKDVLSRAKNPYTKKILSEKIGSYRSGLAGRISNLEISLIDGKRHNMFIDNSEKLAKLTYDNPELYNDNLSQLATALNSLPLSVEKKDQLLARVIEKLSIAASTGIMRESPSEFLNGYDQLKEAMSLNVRIKLEHQAKNLISQNRRMQQSRVRSLSNSHFASILKTGQGIEGFNSLAANSMEENDYIEFSKKEELYKQAHLISDQLKHAPFSSGIEILEGIKPSAGDDDYSQREQIYNILQKQFQQQIRQAGDDPAKFVEELFIEDIGESGSEMAFTARLMLRKSLQDQKGMPPHMQKYLMNSEREEYIRRLQGDDANAIREHLDSIMALGDDNYQLGLELLSEITKDHQLSVPTHFYSHYRLYNKRNLANIFAQIIPVQKQLFSSASTSEKRELDTEINDNKIFRIWESDMIFQQPYNIGNSQIMHQGIRDLARFYQLSHKMKTRSAVDRAVEQMITDCYMEPVSGLQMPRQIIDDGQIIELEEEYIQSSLLNLQRQIISNAIPYDLASSFGYDCESELAREKIQTVLKDGRWFVSPDEKQIYYAYQMQDGSYQSLMINEHEKLAFDIISLNEPETESVRQLRLRSEIEEVIKLNHGLKY